MGDTGVSPEKVVAQRHQEVQLPACSKGRVERAIRYIRDAFFAAREFTDLDDLNAQALLWCDGVASDRPWPEDATFSVRRAFATERERLLALPPHEYALGERVAVAVGKTPYLRFDLNDYSVPHTHVRRTLAVPADERRLRVFDGPREIAAHRRSWDSGARESRILPTSKHWSSTSARPERTAASTGSRMPRRPARRCCSARPSAATTWARSPPRCCGCSSATARQRCSSPSSARCSRACRIRTRCAWRWSAPEQGLPPPTALGLSEEVARRNAPVRSHALASYDRIGQTQPRGDDDE
jgi:hypothetical protein